MAAPAMLAATVGQAANAGHVNQLLSYPAATAVWQGIDQAAQLVAGTGGVNSNALWIAQSFATVPGQTLVGRVWIAVTVTGTPLPLTVSLMADVAGTPSGVVATMSLPREFAVAVSAPGWVSIPMPVTVTPSTTYHIVTQTVGDVSDYYTWNKSNQVSGAQTSPDGITWTSQAYGLLYAVYDQSTTALGLAHLWASGGAAWAWYTTDSNGRLSQVFEYTAGQTTAGYLAQVRTLSYSGNAPQPIGVA